jgi:hypothetical protein
MCSAFPRLQGRRPTASLPAVTAWVTCREGLAPPPGCTAPRGARYRSPTTGPVRSARTGGRPDWLPWVSGGPAGGARRIARNALSPAPARVVTSRDTVGSEAMGPNSSGDERDPAISARQSPPNASANARSATFLPGSCADPGRRHRSNPTDRPRSRPETRNVSASSRPPVWQTIPDPSDDTTILRPEPIAFTRKGASKLWRPSPPG